MPTSPGLAAFLYMLSGLLDAFDGYAARALNQGKLKFMPIKVINVILQYWGVIGGLRTENDVWK